MRTTAGDAYVAAFVARRSAIGQPVLNRPGMYGGLSSADHPLTRLLITDDWHDELAVLLPAATGLISDDAGHLVVEGRDASVAGSVRWFASATDRPVQLEP